MSETAPNDHGSPIFVLCCARSGSTLLRYLLDTHPAVACPPELHVALLCMRLNLIGGILNPSTGGSPVLTRGQIKEIVSAPLERYAAQRNKTVWCEKSVFTVDHLPLVYELFPAARFICLYRHCLDVVSSGVEASKYGIFGYGFDEYLRRTPENLVAALMTYWIEKTSKIAEFEARYSDQTHRINYETMVCEPTRTCKALFSFLELPWDASLVDAVFTSHHDIGPGDSKITAFNEIRTSSVRYGGSIPSAMIPRRKINRTNELLETTGYGDRKILAPPFTRSDNETE